MPEDLLTLKLTWLFISKDIETCQNGLKVGGESNVVEEILCA